MLGEMSPAPRSDAASAPSSRPEPTPVEEFVHALTHGIGAVLAIATLVALVVFAAMGGSALHAAVASVFGASLTLVYVASSLYHAIPPSRRRAKALFRILDHAAIHLLIAGTYTPIALVAVGGAWGVSLASVAWSLALVGVIVESSPLRHHTRLSLGLYLLAGWMVALALPVVVPALSSRVLAWLVLGGVAYTAGVPFFIVEGRRWMHAAWHGFVLVGSAFHVLAVVGVLFP